MLRAKSRNSIALRVWICPRSGFWNYTAIAGTSRRICARGGAEIAEEKSCQLRQEFDSAGTGGRDSERSRARQQAEVRRSSGNNGCNRQGVREVYSVSAYDATSRPGKYRNWPLDFACL